MTADANSYSIDEKFYDLANSYMKSAKFIIDGMFDSLSCDGIGSIPVRFLRTSLLWGPILRRQGLGCLLIICSHDLVLGFGSYGCALDHEVPDASGYPVNHTSSPLAFSWFP
jgi:hypothetical protein